ncbi:PAS domain S-box protein [uncultured Methanospirillum sp.]|uniref:PAS domain S-box protein n=1 Tax=uncultured Methanospirillum sp. TaxID=262503 RepID=UPI0029C86A1C|nr:PAS domain S-box protein [uncultured Methanospirillum sp.]
MRGLGVIPPALCPASLYDRIALSCGFLAVIIGSIAFTGWVLNIRTLSGIRVDYIPMAPNTSLLVILLGCAICCAALFPAHAYSRQVIMIISCFGVLLAGITIIGSISRYDLQLDFLLFHPTDTLGSVPIGRMSPVTALCFLLVSSGLLLTIKTPTVPRWGPQVGPVKRIFSCKRTGYAALIGTAVSCISGVMILGYWYDAPLLYGGSVIPVAFPTTVALCTLGIGLVAISGPGTWPLSRVSGPSVSARLLRGLLPVIILLTLLLSWVTILIGGRADSTIVLSSAFWVIISVVIVYVVVSRLSITLGDELEQAEAERRKSEQELKESQELLLMAQEIGKSGSWVYNPESRMVWQSPEASRIYGFPPVAREYSLSDLERCIVASQNGPAFGDLLDGKADCNILLTINPADGSPPRTIHAMSRRELDPDGRLVRTVGIIQDVTEQHVISRENERLIRELGSNNEELGAAYEELTGAEEELRSQFNALSMSEERLRETTEYLENLLSIANVPIIVWDSSFRITRINRAFEDLVGRSAGELVGEKIMTLFPAGALDRSERLVQTTRDGVRWETVELEVSRNDGSIRTVVWNSATLYSPDGTTPVATIAQGRDITDQKRLEYEKDRAIKQIQKNLVQLSFLNDEIRNPLTLIAISADMSDDDGTGIIMDQVERIDKMITQVDQRSFESEKILEYLRKHSPAAVTGPADQNDIVIPGSHVPLVEEVQAELYTILDSIDAVVYVADMETYEILFLNRQGRGIFGDFAGKRCYEYIQQNQSGPCPFCTNHLLVDESGPTGVHHWEFLNTKNGRWYDCRDRAIRWNNGRLVRLEIATDITDLKQAEERLRESETLIRKKLDALLSPEGGIGVLDLSDIIDVPQIQRIMNDFHSLTGILVAILDLQGTILVAAGWQDICTKFHRANPETCRNCVESDTVLSQGVLPGTYKTYRCKNHMWDISTPIMVGGVHLGNLFLGQFFYDDEVVDEDLFREQAHRYGFDTGAYLEALEKVPRLSREKIDAAMQFYTRFILLVTQVSWSNIKLARIVHERDLLLASVRENEEKYRQLIEHANDGIVVTQKDRLQLANTRMEEISGYTKQDLLSLPFVMFIHPDDRAMVSERYRQRLEGLDIPSRYLFRLVRADGRTVWVEVSAVLVEWEGSPATLNFITDITERKLAEDALRVSEGRLSTLVQTLPDLIWLKDTKGVYIACNPMFERFLGAKECDIVGKTDYDFMSSELAEFFLSYDRKVIESGNPGRNEEWITFADDGHRALLDTIKTPMYDSTGTLIGVLGIGRDITSRREAEEGLISAQERLNEAHRLAHFGTWDWIVDPESTTWSEEIYVIAGIDPGRPAPNSAEQRRMFTPSSWERLVQAIAHSLTTGESYNLELEMVRPDGSTCWIQEFGGVKRDENRMIIGMHGTLQDIHERKQAETALYEANHKLHLLTSLTRHDILNQVSALELLLDLASQSPDVEKTREYIRSCTEAAEQIERTIGFTREYERFGFVSSGWQRIRGIISSAMAEIAPDGDIVENTVPATLEVYADPILRKVFTTLIENAIRHGGEITYIRFSVMESADPIIIICEDDGVGVPTSEKELIFGHGYGKHTGIGLFLVQEILSITGLSIRETGVPGEGARFEILVPAGKFRIV